MKTKFNRMVAILLAIALVTALVPANAEAAAKRKVSLYAGQGTTLKAVKGAKWKSSNKKVATVSKKGKVKAKKAGKATISAKKGKRTWKFTVTVKNPYLAKSQLELNKDKTETVKMVGANVKSCSSSNEGVAKATRMKGAAVRIWARSAGNAVVSVKATDGKTYTCNVTVSAGESDNGRSRSAETPAPGVKKCREHTDHEWKEISRKYVTNNAGDHWQAVSYECVKCLETTEKKENLTKCTAGEWVITKNPSCAEAGEKTQSCDVCGAVLAMEEIPNAGHDFEYVYKKQVTVRDDWNLNYDHNNEHGWEGMGERTATCRTCGESFEEVGFDTGVELEDGSQAVVWGVYEGDATEVITNEINKYRNGYVNDEGEKCLEPLAVSEDLNHYALFRAAQFQARGNLKCVGQMGKGWATPGAFAMTAPVGEKINLVEGFLKLGGSFGAAELKYSGGALFRYETENGEFQNTLVAVGDTDDHPRITCKKVGHDRDYGWICHRCGVDGYSLNENGEEVNPYYWLMFEGSSSERKRGCEVHVGSFPRNDHEGLVADPGGFDTDHDGICDGCGGPILLAAGMGSWNYCNLALFGYGGMEFDKFVSDGGTTGYFEQSNWKEKIDSYVANGKRIEAEESN